MNRWKSWIGAALIVLSAAGLIFWEMQGRETFQTKPVLVAAMEIPAGTIVSAGAFTTTRIPSGNLVEGALDGMEEMQLLGRCAKETILKNQQIAAEYFVSEEERMKAEESVYVLPPEWILMRSSALRKGDLVALYGGDSLQEIGEYRLAFVKDQTEQEVTDPGGGLKSETLDRTYSTAEISHVEVITTLEEYGKIRNTAASEGGILIVGRSSAAGTSSKARAKAEAGGQVPESGDEGTNVPESTDTGAGVSKSGDAGDRVPEGDLGVGVPDSGDLGVGVPVPEKTGKTQRSESGVSVESGVTADE